MWYFNNFNNSDIKILITSAVTLLIIFCILLTFQVVRILINRYNNKKYVWNSVIANIVDSNQDNPKNINKIINHKTNWDYEYTCLKKIYNLEVKSGIHIESNIHSNERYHKVNQVKKLKIKAFNLFEKNKNNSIFTNEFSQKNKITDLENSITHESAKEANFAKELLNLEAELEALKLNNLSKHSKKVKKVLKK